MRYYTFEIDGTKVGYFEIEDVDGVLYQNAYIEMDGDKFENPFGFVMKMDLSRVTDSAMRMKSLSPMTRM